ncbi:MAG TPA: hypothetical protein VHW23_45970 [Kofleriaceae bacterium]|nr:hypothetical protein [Kofleriaceae bacterium]
MNESTHTNTTELAQDDPRGEPHLTTDDQRADDTAASGERTMEQPADSSAARTPGFRYDDPDSLLDIHELTE